LNNKDDQADKASVIESEGVFEKASNFEQPEKSV